MHQHCRCGLTILLVAAFGVLAAPGTGVSDVGDDCGTTPDAYASFRMPEVVHALVDGCAREFSAAENQYAADASGLITSRCAYFQPDFIRPIALTDKRKFFLWIATNLSAEGIQSSSMHGGPDQRDISFFRVTEAYEYESELARSMVEASGAAREDFWRIAGPEDCGELHEAVVRGFRQRVLDWHDSKADSAVAISNDEVSATACDAPPEDYYRRYWHPEVVHAFIENCRLAILPVEYGYVLQVVRTLEQRCNIEAGSYAALSIDERQLWGYMHTSRRDPVQSRYGSAGPGWLTFANSGGWQTGLSIHQPAYRAVEPRQLHEEYFTGDLGALGRSKPVMYDFHRTRIDCSETGPRIVDTFSRRVAAWYDALDPALLASVQDATFTSECGEPPDELQERYSHPEIIHAVISDCAWNFNYAVWNYGAMIYAALQSECPSPELSGEQQHKINIYYRDVYSQKMAAAVFVPAGSEDTEAVMQGLTIVPEAAADLSTLACDAHSREYVNAWRERAISFFDARYGG